MAIDRNTMRGVFTICIVLMWIGTSHCFAQKIKTELVNNWVKFDNAQYGFVVGVKKDTLYFITATNGRVRRQDERTSVILGWGMTRTPAHLVTQFEIGDRKNIALYYTTHHKAAKAVGKEYYDEREPVENLEYKMMIEGRTDLARSDDVTEAHVPERLYASYSETITPHEDYYFEKDRGKIQQGMVILNETGQAVLGIVADTQGATGDRFSVVSITAIEARLSKADRNTCRYFNLIKRGESKTECALAEDARREEFERQEAARLEQLRKKSALKDMDRKDRRDVRRGTDYWFSFAPTASFNLYSMHYKSKGGIGGTGYSLGTSIYFDPNPTASLPLSIRPRYTFASLNMPEDLFGAESKFPMEKISMAYFELPIVVETSQRGVFFGIGYVPVKVQKMTYTSLQQEYPIPDHAKFLHRLHLETGAQTANFRFTLTYLYQFGSFMSRDYEIISGGEIMKPFEKFEKRFHQINLEVSYRLWSQWREP